jgi:hypothetical protein
VAIESLRKCWNLMAEANPPIQCKTKPIKAGSPLYKAAKARMSDPDWRADAQEAMAFVPRNDWCLGGRDGKGWVANLTWFVRQGTVDDLIDKKRSV